jgi:hypothetical protein
LLLLLLLLLVVVLLLVGAWWLYEVFVVDCERFLCLCVCA